jgi:hypothetical protein
MTPLAASISDATIWSVTFDDTKSVNNDRNSFIIQATDVKKKVSNENLVEVVQEMYPDKSGTLLLQGFG